MRKKLRIAVEVLHHPAHFEGEWEGNEGWVIDGEEFDRNPRDLIDEEDMDLVNMFHRCDMGMAGRVWPDGGTLLDQPTKLVRAFSVISSAVSKARKSE